MKLRSLFFTIFFFTSVFSLHAQSLTVATFNLRFDNPRDIGNLWADRAPVVANLIRFHDFDIFGTQEGLVNQLNDVSTALPGYNRYGIGRTDGKQAGEFSAIYYKKNRFKLLKSGDFWLSETPDKPSLGWDAKCCNRICSWVYLQDLKTRKRFYVFNVHFDHEGQIARIESAKLMLKKIKEIAGNNPVLLTGDFNGGHDSEWYKTLANSRILKDTYSQIQYPYANNGSFQGFGKDLGTDKIIDHIFMSEQFSAFKWGILTDSYHGKYPSDHFPVVAVVKL
jgi:endonuclease/exonuclease/phosphatase family metal-dependent hydrolase